MKPLAFCMLFTATRKNVLHMFLEMFSQDIGLLPIFMISVSMFPLVISVEPMTLGDISQTNRNR